MRLIPSDPDIQTIVNRISDGDINLQPNFQRGEVWSENKKVRLIDSILRQWHVPPIHVVEIMKTGKQDVLDGQQRLVSIRDFVEGGLKINGNIEPLDYEIQKLDGFTYRELPDFWRRKFDKFTIRVYSITDYLPSEPGELFFRLNQPTSLTSAEQRNAFFGPAREQIKELVEMFEGEGLTRRELGFSNSRMAYDDVVARLCVYLEWQKLTDKVTANILADRYRADKGFNDTTILRAQDSIRSFSESIHCLNNHMKFNKATLLSWFIFVSVLNAFPVSMDSRLVGDFIGSFESARANFKKGYTAFEFPYELTYELFSMFTDRSSSRVADVSSVLVRDFIIWVFFSNYIDDKYVRIQCSQIEDVKNFLRHGLTKELDIQDSLLEYIDACRWGSSI